MIHYKKTGKFEGRPVIEVPRRYYDIFWFIFWVILTCIPLYRYIIYLIFTASIIHKMSVIVIVSACKYMTVEATL